jgi:hypothetical protein
MMFESLCQYNYCCEICPLSYEDCPITKQKELEKEQEEQKEVREYEGMF